MRCSHCHHEKPAHAKVLSRVRSSICPRVCPVRAQLPQAQSSASGAEALTVRGPSQYGFASPQSYTPPHLAEKILTSWSALE